jgi:hypothetical protein
MATVSVPQPASLPKFPLLTETELAALPPPVWLIEGIFEKEAQVMVFGQSGHGKSFVTLDMALCIATNREWQGHEVTHGPVVYVAGEGGIGMARSIEAWKIQKNFSGPLDEAFFVLEAPQLMKDPDLCAFIDGIKQRTSKPVLIVIDTFARAFVGGDENVSKDTGVWIAAAKKLQEALRTTVMTVHHSGKARGKRTPPERGSSALGAAMDTMIQVEKSKKTITLLCKKQKNAEGFEEFALTLEVVDLGGGVTSCALTDGVVTGLGNVGLNNDHRRLLKALSTCPTSPTPVKEWRAAVDADGGGVVPERTFIRWRRELIDEYVTKSPKGCYELTPMGLAATAKHPPSSATA